MLPWTELDHASQNQDRFIAAVLLDQWAGGRLTAPELPMAIHEAWRRYVMILGRAHPHAQPFDDAHATGAEDHVRQAQRAEVVLRRAAATR